MPDAHNSPTVLILFPEVKRRCGGSLHKATALRWAKQGTFPAPVRLTDSGSRIAWREHEIDAWINGRQDGTGRPCPEAWNASGRRHDANRASKQYHFVRRAP